MLGLRLEQLTPQLRARLRYEGDGRVVVGAVLPGSDADRAGLQPGDIILQADRKEVASVGDVRTALRDGRALLYIERGGQRFFKPIASSK
jgi:S1-C subfamily serine protease